MLILTDTREQKPFSFNKYEGVDGSFVQTLTEGDYTLFDYPNIIVVERKASVLEISANLGKNYDRFKRELEKMQKYKEKYCVCEFSFDDLLSFPKNINLPYAQAKQIKMNGKFMLSRINDLEAAYGIKFLFFNDRQEAEEATLELFKNAITKKD